MKNSTLFIALTVGAALMIGASGCKHKPVDPTDIPGQTRVSKNVGGPGDLDLNTRGIGEPTSPVVVENPPIVENQGVPISSNDAWTDLMNKPHNENRDIFANDTVYFDTDSSTIKTSEQPKLENIAKYLKDNPQDCLTVEGYCDERGTEGYNLALGDKRALAVREYLVTLGVESGRMHTVSFGEANPADAAHNESAWQKNRRGFSVLISPK